MLEFPQYAVYTWCILVEMSGQHVPECHIPVKFQGDAMLISYVHRLYIPRRKTWK